MNQDHPNPPVTQPHPFGAAPQAPAPVAQAPTTDKVVAVRFGNNEDFAMELQQIRQQIVSGLDRLMDTAMAYSQQAASSTAVKTTPSVDQVVPESSTATNDETAGWASATTVVAPEVVAPTETAPEAVATTVTAPEAVAQPTLFPQSPDDEEVVVPQPVAPDPRQGMPTVNPEHAAGSPFSAVASDEQPQPSDSEDRKFPSLRELLKMNGAEDSTSASSSDSARVLAPEKAVTPSGTTRKSLVPQPRTVAASQQEEPAPAHFVPGAILKQAATQHQAPVPQSSQDQPTPFQAEVVTPHQNPPSSPFSTVQAEPVAEPIAEPIAEAAPAVAPAVAPAAPEAPALEPFAAFPPVPQNNAPNWGEQRNAS